MKGQAFVEFDCESAIFNFNLIGFDDLSAFPVAMETATKALQLANGYIIRDKPLVISYGRDRDSKTTFH